MTAAWKAEARAAMEARGMTDADLGRAVGVKRDTIGKMFLRQTSSSLVPRVCEVLGLAPPMTPTPTTRDDKVARIVELLADVPDEVKDSVIIILEARRRG